MEGVKAGAAPAAKPVPPRPSPFEDAALYDALFAEFDFDRGFYLALARAARGPVLEVTCGTGRVLIPILEAGVDIEGIDLSAPMLERLVAKARARGLDAKVHHADMRSFRLQRRYALVIIPFNGFVHCLTTADQLDCLCACRAHLQSGGRLAFNTFFPAPDRGHESEGVPVLEDEGRHPDNGRVVRIYDTRTHDWVAQVQHSEIEIQELDGSGRVAASHRSATDMRWTWKPELELLLRAAGFARWEIAGGFGGEPVSTEGELLVVSAWKV